MRLRTSTALAALILGFTLTTQAIAQDQVQVFDEAPSLEQLRAILVPDSGPGMSRKIEIMRDGANAAPSVIAPATITAPQFASPSMPQLAPAQAKASDHADAAAATAAATPKNPPLKPAALPKAPTAETDAVAFRINFMTGSDAIPTTYRPHLDRIVDLMNQEPSLALTIEGHTDAFGNADYNLELSKRRAVSVMRYLVGHGIDGSRLVAIGKGKTTPLMDDPFDGRNRRVQFVTMGHSGT